MRLRQRVLIAKCHNSQDTGAYKRWAKSKMEVVHHCHQAVLFGIGTKARKVTAGGGKDVAYYTQLGECLLLAQEQHQYVAGLTYFL